MISVGARQPLRQRLMLGLGAQIDPHQSQFRAAENGSEQAAAHGPPSFAPFSKSGGLLCDYRRPSAIFRKGEEAS